MLAILENRTYRHLFLAQVIALVGTGLATVALGLLAFELAGAEAGAVLGTALAIKMIAYVGVAPVASAFAERVPRRAMLVALDLVRAAVAVFLPFVTEIWQVYVLIFVLQSASAAFTPTFQATIPDILPDEKEYTRALSLSRLAYDLESVVSPMLAAALLAFISFHSLFAGTVIGFLVSAALVISVVLPSPKPSKPRGIYDRTTRGIRIYLATPRLRGLLAINLAVASAGALVIVNTVVYVQAVYGLDNQAMALALAAFGGGSMVAALALPKLLDSIPDRTAMLGGASLLAVGTLAAAALPGYGWLLPLWFLLGVGYSTAQTPSGRLLRRSANPEDRPALFAAQFALSHACWLIAYPLAGWAGATLGLPMTAIILAALAAVAIGIGFAVWPADDPEVLEHGHADLSADHPHLAEAGHGRRHAHAYVIDDMHAAWPRER
ncbi:MULTISPECIES: MFS transporter [Alphaproteobacteria]|jgi:MFS family permease|uniref:MFS transporter n=8 Tax=Alphaproteobacteria TaxID=28211 RepID=A0A5C6S6E4_9RHOB|nr:MULTISPECIES: MFS transporter [Alphaproteobacteria]MCV0383058.1 MFS transporter [Erythrobacter sp.]ARC35524.1 MFS transporter [Paracoccus yeei]AZY93313.1 MFS transporter [Paracoccus sp. Arc7-R13]MBO6763751.1 MFS transporter [Maricaulis sp.]MDP5305581.1 MFS transporter [Paracoccus sp. 2205BS29-5]